eukprot:g6596.t1
MPPAIPVEGKYFTVERVKRQPWHKDDQFTLRALSSKLHFQSFLQSDFAKPFFEEVFGLLGRLEHFRIFISDEQNRQAALATALGVCTCTFGDVLQEVAGTAE